MLDRSIEVIDHDEDFTTRRYRCDVIFEIGGNRIVLGVVSDRRG